MEGRAGTTDGEEGGSRGLRCGAGPCRGGAAVGGQRTRAPASGRRRTTRAAGGRIHEGRSGSGGRGGRFGRGQREVEGGTSARARR